MKGNIEERACQLALYIIENRTTVRAAAQKFGISKSTVHKDLSERLPAFNQPLYLQVKGVLEENKAERHRHPTEIQRSLSRGRGAFLLASGFRNRRRGRGRMPRPRLIAFSPRF